MSGRSLGKRFKSLGYSPNLPIFMLPGYCSSVLKVKTSSVEAKWNNTLLWCNSYHLAKCRATGGIDSWIHHMMLNRTLNDSNEGVEIEVVEGSKGCGYLDMGGLTKVPGFGSLLKRASYVLGPLIENLEEIGYTEDYDLFACPFDFRVAPGKLEETFFPTLTKKIEKCVRDTGKPVVMLGHSMGNKAIHYYLHYMEKEKGRSWIDSHIYSFVAVGSPWIGAPKILRALVSGAADPLDWKELVLTYKNAYTLARRMASSLWLVPEIVDVYTDNLRCSGISSDSLVFVKGDSDTPSDDKYTFSEGKKEYFPVLQNEVLKELLMPEGEKGDMWNLYNEYYIDKEHYGLNNTFAKPPPVKRLHNVYGCNIKTEKLFFYKKDKRTGELLLTTDKLSVPHHEFIGGIAYETEETPQFSLLKAGKKKYKRSGDGTVTYESLNFPETHWKDSDIEIITTELPGCEHRETPSTQVFFEKFLVPLICLQTRPPHTSPKSSQRQSRTTESSPTKYSDSSSGSRTPTLATSDGVLSPRRASSVQALGRSMSNSLKMKSGVQKKDSSGFTRAESESSDECSPRHHPVRLRARLSPSSLSHSSLDVQTLSWKSVRCKSVPSPRQLHTAVSYKDKMYIYGGTSHTKNKHFFGGIEVFDFVSQEWSKVVVTGAKPVNRHSHTALVYKDDMWIFGGISKGDTLLNDVWRFNFVCQEWFRVDFSGDMPVARWGHSTVLYNNMMYIFGGVTEPSDGNTKNELWKFDLDNKEVKAVIFRGETPVVREFVGVAVFRDRMYIYGGHCLYSFDFSKQLWTKLQTNQDKEGRGAIIMVTGHWLLIKGGQTTPGVDYPNMIVYDCFQNVWVTDISISGSPCSTRYFHSSCIWRGILCIFGGHGEDFSKEFNDLYLFGKGNIFDIVSRENIELHASKRRSIEEKKEKEKHELHSSRKKTKGHMSLLPHQIKLLVLGFLDYHSLTRMGSVNKEWYFLGITEELWEKHFLNFIRVPTSSDGGHWSSAVCGTYSDFSASRRGIQRQENEFYRWQSSLHEISCFWKETLRDMVEREELAFGRRRSRKDMDLTRSEEEEELYRETREELYRETREGDHPPRRPRNSLAQVLYKKIHPHKGEEHVAMSTSPVDHMTMISEKSSFSSSAPSSTPKKTKLGSALCKKRNPRREKEDIEETEDLSSGSTEDTSSEEEPIVRTKRRQTCDSVSPSLVTNHSQSNPDITSEREGFFGLKKYKHSRNGGTPDKIQRRHTTSHLKHRSLGEHNKKSKKLSEDNDSSKKSRLVPRKHFAKLSIRSSSHAHPDAPEEIPERRMSEDNMRGSRKCQEHIGESRMNLGLTENQTQSSKQTMLGKSKGPREGVKTSKNDVQISPRSNGKESVETGPSPVKEQHCPSLRECAKKCMKTSSSQTKEDQISPKKESVREVHMSPRQAKEGTKENLVSPRRTKESAREKRSSRESQMSPKRSKESTREGQKSPKRSKGSVSEMNSKHTKETRERESHPGHVKESIKVSSGGTKESLTLSSAGSKHNPMLMGTKY
eukprot:TRINITY_DN1318_c0_g1_i7.p1 TRINITY_DN1318_c0_g1~~TRINITY_DN1318_c0_g1_i7.p1  ORF type:complete len:1526 (-),score=243.36 TRINITY_DN1318_c0_g1_i7:2-4579(-)